MTRLKPEHWPALTSLDLLDRVGLTSTWFQRFADGLTKRPDNLEFRDILVARRLLIASDLTRGELELFEEGLDDVLFTKRLLTPYQGST